MARLANDAPLNLTTMSPPHIRLAVRATVLSAVLTAFATSCERPQTAAPGLDVSVAQFQQLRWLEGTWRGTGGGTDAFFEGYRWVDDSTIRKVDFADSTVAVVTDSGDIALRSNRVRSVSSTRSWVVVALDSTSVRFAPERNASNGFEWRRRAPGSWTARLTWDSAGVAKERVYEMRAITRLAQ